MRALPCLACHQAKCRSVSFKRECIMAIGSAKRCSTRWINCGVKPISGTNNKTCLLPVSTFSIAEKYTSVLPLPVTPCNKEHENVCLLNDAEKASTTIVCCSVKVTQGTSLRTRLARRGSSIYSSNQPLATRDLTACRQPENDALKSSEYT